MAKIISQKTFDDVVLENMREFEMDADEAVQDAIQQFESQEINLSVIVKDPSIYAGALGGDVLEHSVVSALKALSHSLENAESFQSTDFTNSLAVIKKECDIGLSHRCLAGNNDAYPIFYETLNATKNESETLKLVLASFCALVNGQPDLIDDKGIALLITLLKQYREDPSTEELIVKAIRLNCVKHERNRQEFIELDLITLLTEMLITHKSSSPLVKETCISLRALTMDDDIRVPFGKAHENAKCIVTEGDALKSILMLCEEHVQNLSVLAELFLTLSCLAVRDEFCQEVMHRGGLQFILQAFKSGIREKIIVRQALIVLKTLAGNDEVKSEISKLGGIELIVLAMTTHQAIAPIAAAACRVLTAITLRNTDNCRKVVDCQGPQHIVQAMKLHPKDVSVQKNACMALRNLVSRTKDLSASILTLGAEGLLNNAMNLDKDVFDDAKAALRDLGCKVELHEPWKGQGGIPQ